MGIRALSYGIVVVIATYGLLFYLQGTEYWSRKKIESERIYYHLGVAIYRIVDADS